MVIRSKFIPSLVFTILIMLTSALSLYAQSSPMQVSVSPRSGTKGEVYSFRVLVDGSGVSKPRLSSSQDFEIHYVGPKVSINISPRGRSFSTEYLYTLFPKRTGTLKTPVVELEDQGQVFTSESIEIEVREGEAKEYSDVSVTQKVSPREAYVGQQIGYTVEILTKTQLAEGKLDDLTIDDVWQEPLGEEEHGRRKISGSWYDVYDNRKALFPTKPGSFTIAPRSFDAKALKRTPASNPFDFNDPFGGAGGQLLQDFFSVNEFVPITIKSDPVTFTVKELPPIPKGFPMNGLHRVIVGETTLKMKANDGPIKAGESKSITVEITSVGNLAPLASLGVSSTPDYKIYEEPAKTQSFENNEQLVTRKTFSLSLIPLHAGTIELPVISIGYFDPVQKEYKIAKSATTTIEVGEGNLTQIQALTEKKEAQSTAATTATPSPTISATPAPQRLYEQRALAMSFVTVLYFVLAVVVLGAVSVAFFVWRRRKLPVKLLLTELSNAHSLSELTPILKRYFTLLIGPDAYALSLQQLKRSSYSAKLPASLQLALGQLLDQVEEYSFSGAQCSEEQLSLLKCGIERVIKETPLSSLQR